MRLGNFLFWLFIIIAGAWLLLAHSIGADQDMPAVVYGGAGIALAVGWALRHITRRGLRLNLSEFATIVSCIVQNAESPPV